MGIDQPGDRQPVGGFQRLREPTAIMVGVGMRTDGDDLAVPGCNRLCPGLFLVARPDPTRRQDQVGGAVGLRTQDPARELVANGPTVDLRHPVHEHIRQAGRVLRGVVERGRVAKLRRIEHDDVGVRSHANRAAIGQAEDGSREPRRGSHGLLQRDHLVVDRVANFPGEGAVSARMGLVSSAGEDASIRPTPWPRNPGPSRCGRRPRSSRN